MSALSVQMAEAQALPALHISFPECLSLPTSALFHRDNPPRNTIQNKACRADDAVLQPFLEAKCERDAQRYLEALTRQAAPIIARIVRQLQHVTLNHAGGRYQRQEEQEAEDIYQDAMTLVIVRLRALRSEEAQSSIACYSSYVAATAAHVCHERLRRAHPNRQVCRDRLRYLLASVPGLAVWRDDWGRSVCGLSDWQGRPASRIALLRLHALQENPARLDAALTSPLRACQDQGGIRSEKNHSEENVQNEENHSEHLPTESAGEALREGILTKAGLTGLLTWLGGPVTPPHLTAALIGILGVKEITVWKSPAALGDDTDTQSQEALANVQDRRVNVAQEVEQREFLRRLWREVTHLPPLQRAALLLNLRDGQGRGALALLAHTQTASAVEIAEFLPLPAKCLADAWPALPLEDSRIAQILGVTRQQVINLRKVARARLTRRLREQS